MSDAYQKLAFLYDHYMAEAPYDQWAAYLGRAIQGESPEGLSLLDLGCGTGTLSVMWKRAGFHVVGVDLSEDMLTVARAKLDQEGAAVPLYQQDIRTLDLPEQFNIGTAFCDTINYLEQPEDVLQCFQSVYDHLKPKGLFCFDVHSTLKVDELFSGQTFGSVEEDITYIWECFPGEERHSVYHDLSFFVKEPSGLYRRFDESHYQRTYPIDVFVQMLETAGFKLLSLIGDFDPQVPLDEAERWLFTAIKQL
ncbi:methyltransferase [Pullulanibacillus pueri]|uniref:Methyltransferase n=2 Tax=Pullulanibacillus pueri TaxID=1437324 RepID=A0A8J3ENL2_9BACL|nr:class I SAM-dependent methyltransferase [Pullulanibacillus pueri]GGH84889.1 methyltransferase [Pullulanibacillus pueri]